MPGSYRETRQNKDLLLRWLIGVASGLAALHGALFLLWGSGPVVAVLPWYVPTMHSFVALAALSVSFLSFGRYRVLREPASFWIGLAFGAFAILAVFYILSWPGLLPDERGLIGGLPDTAAWLWDLKFSALAIFLTAAVFLRWPRTGLPGERRWLWLVVAALAAIALVAGLSVTFEQFIPSLVVDGAWTSLQTGWLYALLVAFAAGAANSALRYRQTGMSLLGYVALAETVFAFAFLAPLIGGERYDTWWYWQRILWIGGFSAMLFGLLSEYVGLYRRERYYALMAEERAAQLAATIESMADAVIVADHRGNIVNLNRAALDMLGRSGKEEVLMSLADVANMLQVRFLDGRPIPLEENVLRRALQGQTSVGAEGLLRRADGRDIYFSMSAAPVRNPAGDVVMAAAVVRDVTELKRLERLRDEFLSMAAHELKTPVTTIKGYAQMLSQWEAHDPRERAAFEVVNRQCDRIGRLVQELLEVSRLQLGRLELHKQRFDLGELAAEVVERMQATTTRHRLLLRRRASAPVEADRERIDQVIVNLLDNAIKFSPEGGDVETTVYVRDGEAAVSVRDHGVGIPKDRQAHIFERFYRAHAGTPYDYGGMGMGLHIIREIVARHGGRMWFESEEGRGSTFYFSLPLGERGDNGGRAYSSFKREAG